MKNAELVKTVAERTGLKQTEVKSVFDALREVSIEALENDKVVSIANIVTLKSATVAEKTGESFGKKWKTPAYKAIKASVSTKYRKLS
jgi:nucleoid DNA-binding protein